ncbi:MAG: hypothetical protein MW690_000078 [Methanophagales archaeon]|nr:hypothetical protein [Methanophagales archaeon]
MPTQTTNNHNCMRPGAVINENERTNEGSRLREKCRRDGEKRMYERD